MFVRQQQFINKEWTNVHTAPGFTNTGCSLVLVFGSGEEIIKPDVYAMLKSEYPNAEIVIGSTAGEIIDESVYDDTIVVTAVAFERTQLRSASLNMNDYASSYDAGAALMKLLDAEDLASVFVLSDGAVVNGSELVAGLNENNTNKVSIAGGLAGDAARFQQTFTGLNAVPSAGNVVAIGFYGSHLAVGHGSMGGWDEFGPERTITKADKNVLLELDGNSALELYKQYLGDYVNDLPASALLFPLSLKDSGSKNVVVRTILAINEELSSMTFAGNMPEGGKVRLMKANFDKLIDASNLAAAGTAVANVASKPDLAILISCVGRKLILQQRISEEVEAARDFFGAEVPITGFYSYGEISPLKENMSCELHNQTMTILTLSEI